MSLSSLNIVNAAWCVGCWTLEHFTLPKKLVSNITILKLIPTIWQLTHYLKEFLNDYGGLSVIHLCRSSLCLGRLFIDFWDGFHLLSVSWCFQTSVMLDCQNERSPNFLWSEAGLEKRERLIHQQRVIELMSLCCTVFLNKNQCCLFWERRTDCKKMMNFNEWKFNSFLDNWYGLQIRPTFIYCIWRPLQIFKKRIRYSNPMKIDIFHYFMLHYFYHTQSTMWRTFFSSTSSTLTRPSYRLPPPLYIFL